jgi:signal transduction histidine kinase
VDLAADPKWASISYDSLAWPIAQALATRRCVVVDDCSQLIDGFPLRQWDQLPDSAIVMPICNSSSMDIPHGVLVMGLNLYCPLDKEYRNWIEVTRSQLASALSSVKAYAAEQQRLVETERLEQAKTAWFQGAAHDLRSPLTLVAGPLEELLDSRDLKPRHRATLALAQRNVTRIQRLVNALLDFSRIEAGKLQGRFVPLDLSRYVADLASLFRPAMLHRHIDYQVQIESHDRLTSFDPTLMEIIISNLLSNALKYTVTGTITVRLDYTATHAEIVVIDTGVGIPRAELDSVTDRFKRAATASTRAIEGTGIGLALAKEMIRLHGGDLVIRSQVAEESHDGSHGSSFTATIPLMTRQMDKDASESDHHFGSYGKEVAAEALHSGKEAVAVSTEDGSESDSMSESAKEMIDSFTRPEAFMADMFGKKDTLLIVDDNHDIRRYVKRLFTPYCKVIEASSGQEALNLARRSPPDLILSDLMMPRMNGQELLQAVRRDPITRSVPMILLSAATDESLRLSALTSGVDDFISKPFKPKELVARVHLQMQLGKRRIELEALFLQREREISLLSDYCPSGIIRQSADGKTVYGNAAWMNYAGFQQGDSLDAWLTRVEPEDARSLAVNLEEFYKGHTGELRQTWKWRSGRIVTGTFIQLDKLISGMSGILGCFDDITEREARLQEAEKRRIEAEESKRQQDLLIDFTSHEIRTPVSAILQCSSLVKENLQALRLQLESMVASEKPLGRLEMASLMRDLKEDIDALDSKQIGSRAANVTDMPSASFRYSSMRPGARTYRKRCAVAIPYTTRHSRLLSRRH